MKMKVSVFQTSKVFFVVFFFACLFVCFSDFQAKTYFQVVQEKECKNVLEISFNSVIILVFIK